MSAASPIAKGPGEGETIANPLGGPLTFKARAAETGGALTAFESVALPGEGPPLHRHEAESELVYVLEGRLRFRLDDEERDAPAGAFVFIPKGVAHTWQNVGETDARLLVAFTPAAGGMEDFFDRAAAENATGPTAFSEFAGNSGMKLLGPPLAEAGD